MATAAQPIDITKILPNSFFEGIGKTFVDKLSKTIESKVAALKIKDNTPTTNSTKNNNIEDKNTLSKLFSDIGIGKTANNVNKETKTITDTDDKPKVVTIGGFTQEGLHELKDVLPSFVSKKIPDKEPDKEPDKGGGGGMAFLGGLALLAGGIFALVKGLETDGPFKGLLKLVSRVGIQGGLKLMEKAATTFLKNIKSFMKFPAKIFGAIGKSVKGIFGKAFSGLKGLFGGGVAKEGAVVLEKSAGKGVLKTIFGKVAGFLAKSIKGVPVLGGIISMGFAISRFKQGDIVGGILDLLSALANSVNLAVPGLGTVLSYAIDALNMFLDVKAGGTPSGGGKGKGLIIMGYLKDFGKWIGEKVKDLPVIGPLVDAIGLFSGGNYKEGFKRLGDCIPSIDSILSAFGMDDDNAKATASDIRSTVDSGFNFVTDGISMMYDWMKENLSNIPFIGSLINSIEQFKQGNYKEGFKRLGDCIPSIDSILSAFGMDDDNAKATASDIRSTVDSGFNFVTDGISMMYDWMKENLSNIPFIGSLINSIEQFKQGNYKEGFISLAHAIPVVGMVLDAFGLLKETNAATGGESQVANSFDVLEDMITWIKDSVVENVKKIGSKIIGNVKDKVANAWKYITGGGNEKEQTKASPNNIDKADDFISRPNSPTIKFSSEDSVIGFKAGGAIDKMLGKSGGDIDNTKVLESIDKNTGNANNGLKVLGESMFALIEVLSKQINSQGVNVYPTQQKQEQKAQALESTASAIDAVRNQFLTSIYA